MTLTINQAISKLDVLKGANEDKFIGFEAFRLSREGILIITNLRISFAFINNEDELKFEHYIYSVTSGFDFFTGDNRNFLEIKYAYEKIRLEFNYKKDILRAKEFLEEITKIPTKLTSIVGTAEDRLNRPQVTQEHSYLESKGSTSQLISKQTQPLQFSDKAFQNFFNPKTTRLLSSLGSFTLVGLVAFYLYNNYYVRSPKVKKVTNYAVNFVKMQQCEGEMYAIGNGLLDEYRHSTVFPENPLEFIKTSFKTPGKNDASIDPWGSHYFVNITPSSLRLVSKGPDKVLGTSDDVAKRFELPELED